VDVEELIHVIVHVLARGLTWGVLLHHIASTNLKPTSPDLRDIRNPNTRDGPAVTASIPESESQLFETPSVPLAYAIISLLCKLPNHSWPTGVRV
jgi:hypothetical protein